MPKVPGWGGGRLFWQRCPRCGKKKALFYPLPTEPKPFKCVSAMCRGQRFESETLEKKTFFDD